jgi:hypothetical protein
LSVLGISQSAHLPSYSSESAVGALRSTGITPLPHYSPREARWVHSLVASPSAAGFTLSGGLATLHWCNEAETGSLALRLTRLLRECSSAQITPGHRPRRYLLNEQCTG